MVRARWRRLALSAVLRAGASASRSIGRPGARRRVRRGACGDAGGGPWLSIQGASLPPKSCSSCGCVPSPNTCQRPSSAGVASKTVANGQIQWDDANGGGGLRPAAGPAPLGPAARGALPGSGRPAGGGPRPGRGPAPGAGALAAPGPAEVPAGARGPAPPRGAGGWGGGKPKGPLTIAGPPSPRRVWVSNPQGRDTYNTFDRPEIPVGWGAPCGRGLHGGKRGRSHPFAPTPRHAPAGADRLCSHCGQYGGPFLQDKNPSDKTSPGRLAGFTRRRRPGPGRGRRRGGQGRGGRRRRPPALRTRPDPGGWGGGAP